MDRLSRPRVSAILAAAGEGVRLGAGIPKQFLEVDGRSLLELSLAALAEHPEVDEVIVALPAAHLDPPPSCVTRSWRCPIRAVGGGARRQDSVSRAFAVVSADADVVLVHDAARPFASSAVVSRVIAAAAASGAAIPAIPATDTVKLARTEGDLAWIAATLPRQEVHLAQTPQGFARAVLGAALAGESTEAVATDEAAMVERLGHPVQLVPGDPANLKITTPDDLAVARARAPRAREPRTPRIGTGYDLHRLVEGRRLTLGGVTIPFERGLDGHSDADIVCHAVTDAVLGAAGLGDIGRLFPDTAPEWKDADSVRLLARAMADVDRAGWRVGNVDVTVIAERPKLSPFIDAMRRALAVALGVDAAAVSVKAKTNERVDSMGRGESMACHAVALLVPAGDRTPSSEARP
jgi:2-C-methyl-D-erythritol 4-phosphate cytidylyltransferase / 2-C-methyl-D-erythritol 2,4-cyclodiphosphate synthase